MHVFEKKVASLKKQIPSKGDVAFRMYGHVLNCHRRQPGALLAIEGGVLVCDLANSKLRKIMIRDGKALSAETLVGPKNVDMPVSARMSACIMRKSVEFRARVYVCTHVT
jgi:hypothetical protein